MNIGFRPKPGTSYKCFRYFKDNMITTESSLSGFYLIATNSIIKGETIHHKIPIQSNVTKRIDSAIVYHWSRYRTPNGIVLGNRDLLMLAAMIAEEANLDHLEIPETYMGVPIRLEPGTSVVTVTVEVDSNNLIAER